MKHNVGHRMLNDMPEILLQPYSVDDESSGKHRSVDAEAQASVRAQERESDRLTKEIARLEERNRNLEAEATRTKLKMEELRTEFKASQRAAYDLGKKKTKSYQLRCRLNLSLCRKILWIYLPKLSLKQKVRPRQLATGSVKSEAN